jgi:hypothetical protein
MNIYEQEIKDGLADRIAQNTSVAFQCLVSKLDPVVDKESIKKSIAGFIEDGRNFDLYRFSAILASIGSNKNDDWFLPEEIWAARHTPVYKQVNYGHNEQDIVGVITGTSVIDNDANPVTNELEISNIKDIVSHAVIWSYWEEDSLKDRFAKIVQDIEDEKLFVSMESLFKNFDYMLIKDDKKSIVKRNKETSFLTKYLRIYNPEATGEYNGYRIYRVLRDFTFSGKALVENPANARSIISDSLMSTEDQTKSIASCQCEDCDCCDESIEDISGSFDDGEDDYSVFSSIAEESEKENKRLNKPFRTPGGPKKFSVYVKNDKGNVVKVNFGDPNMSIKRDDPERRKSFRARHNCDNPGPKWKAKYWSCKFWSNPSVTKLLAESIMDPNETVINTLKAELVQAKAELENYKQAEAEKTSAEIAGLKTSNEALQKQVAELTQLAQAAKEDLKKAESEKEEYMKVMKDECEVKVAEANAKLAQIEAEKTIACRVAKLTAVNVESAKAQEIIKTWASVDDAQFDKLVEIYSVKPAETPSGDFVDGITQGKATASVVNPNADNSVEKAVAKEKALAEKIAAQFNFTKKTKGSK